MDKHRKHTSLKRPTRGHFGRNELAFLGAPCSTIQELSKQVIDRLSGEYNVAYVDADHKSFDNPETIPFVKQGASQYMLDKQHVYDLCTSPKSEKFDRYAMFAQDDLVLINGNHFEAAVQIVFLDDRKRDSLGRKLSWLTNVEAIIRVTADAKPPEGFSEAVPNWEQLPVFDANDSAAILDWIIRWMEDRKPVLNALLLAGGKSSRMGKDKATMSYNGQEQILQLNELVQPLVNQVFLSCRKEQEFDYNIEPIYDTVEGIGPMGAILSAMRYDPDAAWLVVACDLPFLDRETLQELIEARSLKHVATAFKNQETGFAEPLITIWEPKSYGRLFQFLTYGYSCPRKVLINSDTQLLVPKDSRKLKNINTPEEYEEALAIISNP